MTAGMRYHILDVFEHPMVLSGRFVRKTAHFAECFALGILLLTTIRSYRKPV